MSKISGDYQYRALTEGFPLKRFWHESRLMLLESVLKEQPGGLALDAGCGSGNLADAFQGRFRYMVGADISLDAAAFTAGRLENGGAVNTSLEHMPFKGSSFDSVFFFEVIEHFEPEKVAGALIELNRVLRPGGRLYITTPNYHSYWPVMEFFLDLFGLVPKMKGEQHLSKFWPSRLREAVEGSGFYVERIVSFNHISPFVSIISHGLARSLLMAEASFFRRLGPSLLCVARKASL